MCNKTTLSNAAKVREQQLFWQARQLPEINIVVEIYSRTTQRYGGKWQEKRPAKRSQKSVFYVGLYSNTSASHAAKSPKRNFTLTSKSKQLPMASWQETTNFLTC